MHVERQLNAFRLQLVDDAAVVNTPHFDFAAIFGVVELFAMLFQRHDVDYRDTKLPLRNQEVWQRFLVQRVDLHQDYILGIVLPDDQFPHQLDIRDVVVAAEVNPEVFQQPIRVDVLLCRNRLISVKRRKGLELYELGIEPTLRVAHQPEIDRHKHGSDRFVGHVVLGRYGLL